jgi:hypothetical protein
MMTEDELDQKSTIILAGVKRLAAVEGFPVTDFALVGETDLDLDEIRDTLWNTLAPEHVDVVPGDQAGSVQVAGIPGQPEEIPELGRSAET